MSEFIKKNGNWFRNNSDGTQTKVLFKDGYFYWTQSNGKKVRSSKKYNIIKFNPRDTILNLKYRLKIKEADKRTAETSAFEKPLNFLSPSLYVGAAFDYFQGESPFWEGIYNGNSGWVPDNFARKYPRATTLINAGTDIAFSHGVGKVYNWGTTPRLIGEGASKKVYSAPFSRKVYSVGGDSKYIQILNSVPGAIQNKLVGYTLEGLPVYSSPKVRMISGPSKRIIKNFILNQFFPTDVIGDTETVFINPGTRQVLLDMEWGKDWLGRTYAVDPEILSTNEYFKMLKRGGKMNVVERFRKYRKGGLIYKFEEGNSFRILNNIKESPGFQTLTKLKTFIENEHYKSLRKRYINYLENKDKIGWNEQEKKWYRPTEKGYDHNQIYYGLDTVYNDDVKAYLLKVGRDWLTEEEGENLLQKVFDGLESILDKWVNKLQIPEMSNKKRAMALGVMYRGDGPKLWKSSHFLGNAFANGTDEDFLLAISDYYNQKHLSSRSNSHNEFWENYKF